MLYRIDLEHFLIHAIDHFTREELLSIQYAIVSAGIKNGSRITNISRFNYLYPPHEIQSLYKEYGSKDVVRQPYFEQLDMHEKDLYVIFILNILKHVDIMIICRSEENVYAELLCEYLSNKYGIDCIDLNELFTKGRVGEIYIDRDAISDKAVDIRRLAGRERIEQLESTRDGRAIRLGEMSKSEKIKKLNELGIQVNKNDYDSLDELLIEEWVEDD